MITMGKIALLKCANYMSLIRRLNSANGCSRRRNKMNPSHYKEDKQTISNRTVEGMYMPIEVEDIWSSHVKVKCNGQPLPERHGEWLDLATAEDVYLKKGEHQKIPLGVAMEMPPGYYAIMAPRSSTFERWGIIQTNSIGIYERDYCWDDDLWFFPAYATREVMIPKGTRICQFQLFKQHPDIEFILVESMGHESRGGWGSTGE